MRKLVTPERAPLLITYIVLITLSILMFVLARDFPGGKMGAAAPGFFPQIVSILLLLMCLLGVLELVRSMPERIAIPRRAVAAMSLSLGYIGAMYLIGYYPATLGFAFLVMVTMREGSSWLRLVCDAVLITLGSYLFFEVMIDTYLPTGALFG